MIKLVQFYPALGVRSLSPFCLKLETYLRLAGIDYEVVRSNDARRAPKGKLPYIIDGDLTIGDSARPRSVAFVRVNEDEIDVRRDIEFAAAQLAHPDHDELLAGSVGSAERVSVAARQQPRVQVHG